MNNIDDADLDRLIQELDRPDPPRKPDGPYGIRGQRVQFNKFLADADVQKGHALGFEVAVVYKYYLAWRAQFTPLPNVIGPFRFTRYLRSCGFRRNRRKNAGGRDVRCLSLSRDTADRIEEFLRTNPVTAADLAIFDPKTRWGRS